MKDFFSIDVLISVPLNTVFTYKSNFKTKIGSVVKIPFGNNNEIVKVELKKSRKKKEKKPVCEIMSDED